MADVGPRPTTTVARRESRALAELFALAGLAIAQPVLDLFGRAPHQFAFRGATGRDVVVFALAVVLVPPIVLWLVEAAVGLVDQRVRAGLHLGYVVVLVWAFVVQVARPLTSGGALMVLAVLCGVGGAAAYRRFGAVKLWLAFAAIAPAVFVGLFLVASPAARLVGGDRVAAFEEAVGTPVPVVLVVFDELPTASLVDSSGNVDADLFPSFGDLATTSHWFRNATTPSTFTWHAVPSIVTGRLPVHDTAPFASDHPQNVFTLLAASHQLNVVESVTRLCPTNLCEPAGGRRHLFGDAVDVMRARLSYSGPSGDPVAGFVEAAAAPRAGEELPDDQVGHTERFATLLDGIVDDSVTLHYLHVLLPHQPLRYLPSGRQYDGPDPDIGRIGDDWGDQAWPAALGRQRHLLQLAYTDALLGQLLDRLREVGVFDDALVIVTADHGIAFRPGGPVRLIEDQRLDEDAAPELMWVPLFVKLPGQQQAEVSDANVLVTDVFPTIADALDIDLPAPVGGRSVFGPERSSTAKPFRHSSVHPWGISVLDEVEVDGPRGLQRMLDLAVDGFLPPAGEPHRLWRIGPSSELVGSPAGDLPLADAELHATPVDVDEGSPVVPALVRAWVDGAAPGDGFAVAVNGTIGATATAYDEGGRTAIAAMVIDDLFHAGSNDITVHRLTG